MGLWGLDGLSWFLRACGVSTAFLSLRDFCGFQGVSVVLVTRLIGLAGFLVFLDKVCRVWGLLPVRVWRGYRANVPSDSAFLRTYLASEYRPPPPPPPLVEGR